MEPTPSSYPSAYVDVGLMEFYNILKEDGDIMAIEPLTCLSAGDLLAELMMWEAAEYPEDNVNDVSEIIFGIKACQFMKSL